MEQLEQRQLLACTNHMYFVKDPLAGGNDMADGCSDATAWASINRVNQAVSSGQIVPGDTIQFRQTDTFCGNLVFDHVGGTPGNPITITRYGTDPNLRPTINAGSGSGIAVRDAGWLQISKLTIVGDNGPNGPGVNYGNGIQLVNDTNGQRFSNIVIGGPTAADMVDISGFGLRSPSQVQVLTGSGIFIKALVSVGTSSQLLPGTGFDNVKIQHVAVYHNQIGGIEVEDNIVYFTGRPHGVDAAGHLVADGTYAHRNFLIDHVDAHDNVMPRLRGTAMASSSAASTGPSSSAAGRTTTAARDTKSTATGSSPSVRATCCSSITSRTATSASKTPTGS
jgi:hypothetical protein